MDLEEQIRLLPERPGCYLYKDASGRIIYVGKARNLRNRVRQYFQSSRNLTAKVLAMVSQIAEIEHIVTDTETEALVLESNLIKKHKPKYNIRLRDDKHYPYLRLTLTEQWPRLVVSRTMKKDGSRYFGPYTNSQAMWDTMKLARRLFPLRTCNDPSRHPRGCLQYHIGRCLGPCLPDFNQHEAYAEAVRDLQAFLEGRTQEVVARIRARMEQAAENLEFERAAELRDQLRAIEKVTEKQKIISHEMDDLDAIAYARLYDEAGVQVFFVRQGKLVGRDQFIMTGADEMSGGEILAAFIQQHYAQTDFVPREILVSEDVPDADMLAEWLSAKRGGRVVLRRPLRGEKRGLVEMVAQNAQEAMAERKQQRELELAATEGALMELQQALGLPRLPRRIECFDISHVQGSEVVASMVVFEDGKPKKEDYRRFKMKVDQNNDFANMAEAVGRRFRRGLAERAAQVEGRVKDLAENQVAEGGADYGGKFAVFPDLLIIDGGKGQLSYARAVMRELGVEHIPTFGLAKEEELLCAEDRPGWIELPRGSQGLFLLQRVRDEAHRFAITYHRKLHRKAASHSRLDDVPGIGPKRKKALLQHFGSLKAIRAASIEELAAVPGLNRELAERVKEALGGATQ
ncbi:MAG: excinuclease ABC subunit UvrC [Symbiobacterium sp.]|uniref:excinuclease ABC subunit UvrC n=1 Tax=Symbiobacterium sp. TaxID=1971213 RepID=UPI003464879F